MIELLQGSAAQEDPVEFPRSTSIKTNPDVLKRLIPDNAVPRKLSLL